MTMPAVVKNSKKRDRMGRVVSTSCANDMTRKRYVASVLFFGGRCCYCSQVLSKEPGQPNQATGEHLTPINPENPESPRGVTRYGNMALACHACNDSRKNQELESWLKKTSLVPPEQKEKTIHRIEAFRKFALYEEYSPQQSQAITDVINELKEAEANLPREVTPQGIFEPQAHREFVSKVKEKLFDLSQTLKE